MRSGNARRTTYFLLVLVMAGSILTSNCGYAGGTQAQGAGDPPSCSGCNPLFSNTDIAVVQQTFPYFLPEEFGPKAVPGSSNLTPADFIPAEFMGPAEQGDPAEKTPGLGITVYTNGYDNPLLPSTFADQGTYYTDSLDPVRFTLTTIQRSPLNMLQQRMGVPLTPNAPTISIDLQNWRVNLSEIDEEMTLIRSQLSQAIPEIAGVDPTNAIITIEPAIFYASISNYGSIWAGGLTTPKPNGTYDIQLAAFYITFDSNGNMIIVNWQDFLVDEAINFYVMSVGDSNLAQITALRKEVIFP